ncbi:hypothetical protein [Cohnella sp. WQ 127256]|uniref:hypothetical protein n=1 Tax=Cohnella sp. WQ 127256 TaxID=2938790 RepID=UPI00211977EA|nr:hypothetical protein [Cohnella sp. WQ 127256]
MRSNRGNRALMIPAQLVAIVSLFLILYSIFGLTQENLGGARPRVEQGGEELFKTLGTLSVFITAVSYAWYHLKKKRKSPSPLVRLIVKWFDKLHKYTGYSAILLIATHGIYFLTQAVVKKETYTGIAAFSLLLSAGIYGFLIKRLPKKNMRKVHFMLATAFALVAIIHAGGSAIMAILCTIVFWGITELIERSATPAQD